MVEYHQDICYYCGKTLAEYLIFVEQISKYSELAKFRGVPFVTKVKRLTIDRKNNQIGYESGNIVKACHICNYIKGSVFTVEDMKEVVKVAYK